MNSKSAASATIHYATGIDGWGDGQEPTDDDRETFIALIEHRLEQAYPGAIVTAEVLDYAHPSSASVRGLDVRESEIVAYVGNEIWEAWCGGERAPSDDEPTIEIGAVTPSRDVDGGALVAVTVDGVSGSAIMVRDQINGGWCAYGNELSHWLSESLHGLPVETVRAVQGEAEVAAARATS